MNGQLKFCLLLLIAISLRGDDWLMYLHDPAHTSFNSAETQLGIGNVNQLQMLWKINVGAPLASGVTVSKGKLYFGAWDGNFYSANVADGSINWKRFVGIAPDPDQPCDQKGIGVTSQSTVIGDT